MKKFIVVTESGSDIPPDLVELYNIRVIPMHVIFSGKSCPDGSIPITDVYDYYKETKKIPSTSATNPDEYQKLYEKIASENPDCSIIHISYSSKASSTYQNALIASAGMKNVYHIDSMNVSGGEAAIILKAVKLIEKQPDISTEELIEKIELSVKLARASFIPNTLDYLKAGGRVSNASYLGASILHLKPLIEIINGQLVSTKKYRGGMGRIAEKYFNDFIDRCNIDREQVYLLFSLGLEEKIKHFMEKLVTDKGFRKITWIQTGCVISTHSGPGAIGIAGFENECICSE